VEEGRVNAVRAKSFSSSRCLKYVVLTGGFFSPIYFLVVFFYFHSFVACGDSSVHVSLCGVALFY